MSKQRNWLEISIRTDGEGAEALAEALRPYAYQGSVVIEQQGDESSADLLALEEEVTVKIYASPDEDTPALRRRIEEVVYYLGRLYPLPSPTFTEMVERDWANAWKDHYHPFRIGRHLRIRPSWIDEEDDDGRSDDDITLVLDPGMAFGTGLHPTTQSCLVFLEKLVQPEMTVLDVGTGSGILSVAAVKLGAGSVLAFDTDDQAVQATQANGQQNGVAQAIEVWQGDLDSVRTRTDRYEWDIVVVNILATVIIRLLKENDLLDYITPTGRLVLSGIIAEQSPEVTAAIATAGGKVITTITRGDWISFEVGRQARPGSQQS